MKITVFTSNQPRHCSYIRELSKVADVVYAVQECLTLFPGRVEDFYRKSPVMEDYFSRVRKAEDAVFGDVFFSGPNVRTLALKDEDLNFLTQDTLKEAMDSDLFLVFGSCYIKPPLVDILIERGAVNIHMGVSPYYRGAGCNFWAMYDGHPNLVGATIHRLSKGLDNGDMLFHAMPKPEAADPFVLGMKAVRAAHTAIIESIKSGEIFNLSPIGQDKSLQIRYTKNNQFTDDVAADYLARGLTPADVGRMFTQAKDFDLIRPVYF